jgi:hypothetical protein
MRIAADGYLDISDGRRVRTPGLHAETVEPMPEAAALSFLLSHSFPGHRRIVRSMTTAERSRIQLAAWADSVSQKMELVDRVWRAITEPVLPPTDSRQPELLQVVQFGAWMYPIYLDGSTTRVMPSGGVPAGELMAPRRNEVLDLARKTA